VTVVWIVIAVVVVAAILYGAYRMFGGGGSLRNRFGDEYDRLVSETGDESAAEAELRRRLKEHEALQLKDVTDEDRARYRDGWIAVQKQFVDDPVTAVRNADQMVSVFATERGYPEADFDGRVAQLSVEHPHVLGHYRDAHAIAVSSDGGRATTEDLRQALVHYRELFAELTGADLTSGNGSEPLRVAAPAADEHRSDVDAEHATPAETDAERADREHAGLGDDYPESDSDPADIDEANAASVGRRTTTADRGVPDSRTTSEG
jgi:hypothetical protein